IARPVRPVHTSRLLRASTRLTRRGRSSWSSLCARMRRLGCGGRPARLQARRALKASRGHYSTMDRQTDPRKPFTTYEDSARPYIRGVELHQTRIQWCTADFHAPVRALREVMGNYLRVTAESAA